MMIFGMRALALTLVIGLSLVAEAKIWRGTVETFEVNHRLKAQLPHDKNTY